MEFKKYRANDTARFFKRITKFVYLIAGTNFWFEEHDLPRTFVKIHKLVWKFLEAMMIALTVTTSPFARYTQENLTEKQNNDILFKSAGTILLYFSYGPPVYRIGTVKELLFSLTVTLKGMYNDETVERKMIKKSSIYVIGLVVVASCSGLSYGLEEAVRALNTNATFVPIIPIWPDIEDRRVFAGFIRIFIYVIWLLAYARYVCIYTITITMSICIGYQFTNLHEYFLSLNDIFDEEGSQEEKEIKYEKAFKVGIKMHTIILRCGHQLQLTCGMTYNVLVVGTVSGMLLLLIQMMNIERTLVALGPLLFMAATVQINAGFVIWSAADITAEAARLPTAMFHSGWHNCTRQSSVRVRKMVTIAMAQAQQIVVIKALGVIDLSYESYVTIVKSSYSVFSVLY